MSDDMIMDISEEFKKLKEEFPISQEATNIEITSSDSELYKKPKKKKKKKEKSKFNSDKLSLLLDPGDLGDDDVTEEDFLITKKLGKKGKRKDLFDIKEAKKKQKQDIANQFNPELAALRKVLKDNEDVASLIRGVVDEIQQNRARGAGKLLNDLLVTLNSTNGNRASVLREIANIKKATIDLNLKAKRNSNEDKARNEEEEGINIIKSLYDNGGRKALLDQLGAGMPMGFNQTLQPTTMSPVDMFDSIDTRLTDEPVEFRSEEGSAYVRYENMRPEYVIFMDGDGSYELDAIDMNGNIMPEDYPRIDIENLGKISVNMDNMVATDETGRTYKIITRE